MVEAGLVPEGEEQLDAAVIEACYEQDAQDKIFGADSNIELRREPTLPWYYPGFFRIVAACFGLIFVTWFVTKALFVW